jgi:hypothetical protein
MGDFENAPGFLSECRTDGEKRERQQTRRHEHAQASLHGIRLLFVARAEKGPASPPAGPFWLAYSRRWAERLSPVRSEEQGLDIDG